ncbi:hypothetical protein Zmor_008242 [Zophobas morio]|uniref:Uncharacterized protein n=1 Tax=Zophobas morio TaxID=2755281 RepID=A0AA38IZ92_9CUCU|nr:hypothetical protein Zmor_008242 [Zophobas morio]
MNALTVPWCISVVKNLVKRTRMKSYPTFDDAPQFLGQTARRLNKSPALFPIVLFSPLLRKPSPSKPQKCHSSNPPLNARGANAKTEPRMNFAHKPSRKIFDRQ